jgi:hypothetical protein
MVLSKRERYISIACVLAVAVLGLDQLVIKRVAAAYSEMETNKTRLRKDLLLARAVVSEGNKATPKWRDMLKSGMKSEPVEAESQVNHAIYNWATASGMTITRVKSDRLTEKTRLPEITFTATGTGSMSSLVQFLYRVQTATLPVKVSDVAISSHKEGTDDLSFVLHVSTIYAPAPGGPAKAASAPSDDYGDEQWAE